MTAFLRFARSGALAPLLSCAAVAAWAQAPEAGGEPSQPPAALSTLPGTVVERNVFVPVDNTGHTGGEYIVVERRVVNKDGGAGDATAEVPTHFILVPQDGQDEESGGSNDEDDPKQPR